MITQYIYNTDRQGVAWAVGYFKNRHLEIGQVLSLFGTIIHGVEINDDECEITLTSFDNMTLNTTQINTIREDLEDITNVVLPDTNKPVHISDTKEIWTDLYDDGYVHGSISDEFVGSTSATWYDWDHGNVMTPPTVVDNQFVLSCTDGGTHDQLAGAYTGFASSTTGDTYITTRVGLRSKRNKTSSAGIVLLNSPLSVTADAFTFDLRSTSDGYHICLHRWNQWNGWHSTPYEFKWGGNTAVLQLKYDRSNNQIAGFASVDGRTFIEVFSGYNIGWLPNSSGLFVNTVNTSAIGRFDYYRIAAFAGHSNEPKRHGKLVKVID